MPNFAMTRLSQKSPKGLSRGKYDGFRILELLQVEWRVYYRATMLYLPWNWCVRQRGEGYAPRLHGTIYSSMPSIEVNLRLPLGFTMRFVVTLYMRNLCSPEKPQMKKRGTKPNAATYTIMLNGLSMAPGSSSFNPVRTALSIYDSISANSTVTASIIHANAMLKVCARQQDMDNLWKVASRLPETGPGAPEGRTYTIILRAIREASQRDLRGVDPNDFDRIVQRKFQSVQEGKRIWADLVFQWKKGQAVVDNFAVNALADLLLDGSTDQDFYDFFALYHQAFGIPILAKHPAAGHDTGQRSQGSESRGTEDVPFVDENDRVIEGKAEPGEQQEKENFEGLFDPVTDTQNPLEGLLDPRLSNFIDEAFKPSPLAPTNSELSIILEACRTMPEGLGIGKAYWRLLTRGDNENRIKPDSHSFHQYLRLLRASRSSRAVLELVRDEMGPANRIQGKTFHIAMSCCRRDKKNINMLNIANGLLEVMSSSLVIPDPRALLSYLDITDDLYDNPQLLMALKGLDVEDWFEKLESYGRMLQLTLRTVAARQLHPHLVKLEEAMGQGPGNYDSVLRNDDIYINGELALKALVRTRHMIDLTLDPKTVSLLPKVDRQWLKGETERLRKYSGEDFNDRFRKSIVVPTRAQERQFADERRQKAQVVENANESVESASVQSM